MEYFTPIERMIIESLNRSPMNLSEIAHDLEIRKDSLFFILQRLILNDYILYKNTTYSLNRDKKSDLIIQLKDKESQKYEVKSILESAKNQYIKENSPEHLQVKKVYLNSHDEIYLQSLLSQMLSFLNKREKATSKSPLAKKKIFYWGSQSYGDVLKYLDFC